MNFCSQSVDVAITDDTVKETEEQEKLADQSQTIENVELPSPDISNLTTDLGDNPYIRRPTHWKPSYSPKITA